mgnify:CR=1 FL=1
MARDHRPLPALITDLRAEAPRSRRTSAHYERIQLGDVSLLAERQGDLLKPLGPSEKTRGEQVSAAVDQINARFGDGAIRYGINAPHPGFFERG